MLLVGTFLLLVAPRFGGAFFLRLGLFARFATREAGHAAGRRLFEPQSCRRRLNQRGANKGGTQAMLAEILVLKLEAAARTAKEATRFVPIALPAPAAKAS